ncbi:MAG: phosphatidate cytidylyltransferase [Burkholderiales bacterium]|nr:phosphatidate cytidylyltransferase [Burkholderiales bacterium]
MLRQRITTAVILLAIVIVCLLIGPWAFDALAAVILGCCLWEWLRLAEWDNRLAIVCSVAMSIVLYWTEISQSPLLHTIKEGEGLLIFSATGTVIWFVLTYLIFLRRNVGWNVPPVWRWVLALIFVPCAWFSLMYLYRNYGAIFMISVLALVWVADISAYFAGSHFKGPKMSPGISPNKTWAGAISAFVIVLFLAYLSWMTIPAAPFWTNAVIGTTTEFASAGLIFLIVLYSITGDLFESTLKRNAGVKDSSNLLPGHGGFYDRMDAQFAVLPLTVFIHLLIQGI